MIDMDAVTREIEVGRAELAASDKAILSPATRTRIWEAMLDPQDDEASYRHRIELKMACVRHVLHLWDRAFPGDGRVEEMLALAQELIDQRADMCAKPNDVRRLLSRTSSTRWMTTTPSPSPRSSSHRRPPVQHFRLAIATPTTIC